MALSVEASREQVLEANWRNMAAFSACFGSLEGGICSAEPDLQLTRSGRGIFNSIVRARFAPDTARDRVAAITAMVRCWNEPVVWRLCEGDAPDQFADVLLAHGWENARGAEHPVRFAGMAMCLDGLLEDASVPDGLSIRTVTDEQGLREWPRIFFEAMSATDLDKYGDVFAELGLAAPDRRLHYTGFIDGKPVTTCMVYLDDDVAGLYAIGTVPELRGQGIGSAITRYALQQARCLGYNWAVLQATDMGYGVYERLGFEEYGRVRIMAYRPQQ